MGKDIIEICDINEPEPVSIVNINDILLKIDNGDIDKDELNNIHISGLITYLDYLKAKRRIASKKRGIKYGFDTKVDIKEVTARFYKLEIKFADIIKMNNDKLVSGEDVDKIHYDLLNRAFIHKFK